ncbi:hypothetical protein SAMN05216516_11630 [Izhakiella capsodis]|uniref:Uncharacterized protein n=1 Tax=Izhakiella capsodis TaxID=1367852 RepID=A0A1I5BDI3_9GAMM|nr:hypothetical protein [Izhakiella capsodis]SFN72774.1 hypothetical protein SAMN05216516_11630 [Izhakiella capsodis]
METVKIEGWKVELFDDPSKLSFIAGELPKRPFFIGYSRERFNPDNFQDKEFITLYVNRHAPDTCTLRLSRVFEVRCTPVYARETNTSIGE